ncbi:sensor histidine kinase [Algoriphagus machipongonensis]|uniref:Sensor histidine kinase n=1 Tax=Algoriphagus machipongonensis TaxID=388413 RepID=A3HVB6_9BACT|nr:histidine kinase [Algoriphagus machipongonensis]EAZ82088.1 sensor histidine kinase [Algoriphagus machipongonensis]
MNRFSLYWILQILGWGFFAFVNIFFAELSRGLSPVQIWAFVVLSAFYLISTHFLRFIVKSYGWFKLEIPQLLLQALIALLALSLINTIAQVFINIAFGTLNPEEDFKFLVIFANLFLSFLFYAIWFLSYFLFHFLDNYNTSLKYEAKINEIRLNHLKSQLNPHFIFNALNSVRALVDEDPAKAKSAITRVSNILRFSLMMDKKQVIEFNDEMNTVKDYLALESIRFEERLQVSYIIEDEAYSYKIPPMMLQTIVENAIKHGISNLLKGGIIEIKCREGVDDDLYIQVKNSGRLLSQPSLQPKGEGGHGLSNTQQRLKLIYGDKGTLRIFNSGTQYVITEIKIPKNRVNLE